MRRREFLVVTTVAIAATASSGARAQEIQDIAPFVREITGGVEPEEGGIDIDLPQLAENGHSVPLTVRVPSPMVEADHVSEIHVIAERNPRPKVATFFVGPWSGRAEVGTRIRLAGTQKLTVVAALSGGRFRIARREVVVATAACLDEASL